MQPTFFESPPEFRSWLEANAGTASELLVGFRKKDSGLPSLTWPESVDEALGFGWIDGVRRRIDDANYSIRFTPRKRTSIWSAINIKRVGELTEVGRMRPAGLQAFEARSEAKSRVYSYEEKSQALAPEYEALLRANPDARQFFAAQSPSYRRAAEHWVMSAKQEPTRTRRLAQLIEDSAASRRLKHLKSPA